MKATSVSALMGLCFVLSQVGVCSSANPDLTVTKGQVTFDSEGNDRSGSRYFSRELHVPGRWSGVTIGRGYDMGRKSSGRVFNDLVKAGISHRFATIIRGGAGKKGQAAKNFIRAKKLGSFRISRAQQKRLFVLVSYPRQEREAKRLTERYIPGVKWNSLQGKMKEILTDLKFRGDYLPTSNASGQKMLRKAVQRKSLSEFKKVIGNRSYWRGVPYDRFRRRASYL